MIYGGNGEGAVGWLVGEENRGLACMFTMMNIARLSVGIQGVGVAERAFAATRSPMRASAARAARPAPPVAGMSLIVEHPDVQAMLLRMKALTAAARAICYATRRGHRHEPARRREPSGPASPTAPAC